MSLSIRDEIAHASAVLELPEEQFRFVRPYEYRDILVRCAEAFLTVGERGVRYDRWWDDFKGPQSSLHAGRDSLAVLGSMLPKEEPVFLLAHDSTKKQDSFWICEGVGPAVLNILGECYGFEYLVASKKFDWLVGEHHSEVLVAIGARMVDALDRARLGRAA